MPAKIDLTGQTFSRLTVLEDSGQRANSGHVLWRCRCNCCNEILARTNDLKMGKQESCGSCGLRQERIREYHWGYDITKQQAWDIFEASIYQHISDLISYTGDFLSGGAFYPKEAYVISYEWIVEGKALAWGPGNHLVITFIEALDLLNIPPENAEVIRDGLIRCINRPRSERKKIGREIYAELFHHDNEPPPLWENANSWIPRAANLDEL